MKISLSENERNLVDTIFSEKFNPIREKFDKEEKQIQWSEVSGRLARYTDWLRRFAKSLISTRINSYVEVYRLVRKFPTEEDLSEISKLLVNIVEKFTIRLSEYISNPFLEAIPKPVSEATIFSFSESLKQEVSLSLAPLSRLFSESRIQNMIKIPADIHDSLSKFRKDYPEPTKTAFIMMRFGGQTHGEVTEAIRKCLSGFGLVGLRADDKQYHDDLYSNILTYIYGCSFGISVFERIDTDDFNPNIAFETGYMFALSKDVCLLKDKTLRALHTDIVGKLYIPFDTRNTETTISQGLSKWMKDKEIIQ
jgi:hypothetical protein